MLGEPSSLLDEPSSLLGEPSSSPGRQLAKSVVEPGLSPVSSKRWLGELGYSSGWLSLRSNRTVLPLTIARRERLPMTPSQSTSPLTRTRAPSDKGWYSTE